MQEIIDELSEKQKRELLEEYLWIQKIVETYFPTIIKKKYATNTYLFICAALRCLGEVGFDLKGGSIP